MADEDLFKNLAMVIPKDIARHSDGSPMVYAKYKDQFLDHCSQYGIALDIMTVKEREVLYKSWETENAEWLKQFDPKWEHKKS